MNTPNNTPQMPQPGDPQFDQKARVYEAWQRERAIAASQALASAQTGVASSGDRNAAALRDVLAAEARIKSRADFITLVSTMTSAERRDPAKAVAKALNELAAIDRALGL